MPNIDALETASRSVPALDCTTSSRTPAGGQTVANERRSKYAAKSPAKNMSSDAKKSTTPKTRGCARNGSGEVA